MIQKSLFCHSSKNTPMLHCDIYGGKGTYFAMKLPKKPSQIKNDFQFHIYPNFIIRNKAIC